VNPLPSNLANRPAPTSRRAALIRKVTPAFGIAVVTSAAACSSASVDPQSGRAADAAANTVTNPIFQPDGGAESPDGQATAPDWQVTGDGDPQGGPGELPDGGTNAQPGSDLDGGTDDSLDAAAGSGDPAALDASVLPEPPPTSLGGLTFDTNAADQELELLDVVGHKVWVEVSPMQLAQMNAAAQGEWDDRYTPGAGPTFADYVVVQDATTLSVANYGKMEVRLIGSSSKRPWTAMTVPNVRIDTNEFQPGIKIGGFEHIRLNNGVVGGIFREQLANRIYRALGYPAARGSHALLGSNVWGDDVWVPMTLMEVYKKRFCNDNAELIGGGESCANMWEFAGDIGNGPEALPDDSCQLSECNNDRLEEAMSVLEATPQDDGFKDAMAPYISWDHFHRFQCLSWMLWTGDDALHNLNNNLIIEREDGKLMWAPYSVDVSMGQSWHQNVRLPGHSAMAKGCQADAECWADTIAACDTLIDEFDALNPEQFLDETVEQLSALNMLRQGDLEDANALRAWLTNRQTSLPYELEHFRYLQDAEGNCAGGLNACSDGTCAQTCVLLPN
jgi:hypothetical protein